MTRAPLVLAVGVLLAAAVVVLYLEWWRAGELEVLNGRVNELDEYLRRRDAETTKPAPRKRTPSTKGATE